MGRAILHAANWAEGNGLGGSGFFEVGTLTHLDSMSGHDAQDSYGA